MASENEELIKEVVSATRRRVRARHMFFNSINGLHGLTGLPASLLPSLFTKSRIYTSDINPNLLPGSSQSAGIVNQFCYQSVHRTALRKPEPSNGPCNMGYEKNRWVDSFCIYLREGIADLSEMDPALVIWLVILI